MIKATFKIFCVLLLMQTSVFAQSYEQSITEYQQEENAKFKDAEKSPLTRRAFRKFKELPFNAINSSYRVVAKLERVKNSVSFKMKTTTSRLPTYEVWAIATFSIDGVEHKLNVYQSHSLRETEEYKDDLFLPFTDLTNGDGTYGGGRFLD